MLIISDVTAHKNAEQERENSRNVVALAEMATVLAHEIRNPLGSLELLTGCLAGDPGLGDESKRCVQHLRAGVRSLSATVNNVLCFHNPGRSKWGLWSLVRRCGLRWSLSVPWRSRKSETHPARDPAGRGDCRQFQRIEADHSEPGLQCAATHAARRRNRHHSLRSRQTESGRTAVIEFADTGSGIQPKDLPHIFEAGFTTTGQTPGLGLTICQRIVEQHGGTINVRSQLGRGTTFRMEFPVL